MVTAVFIDVNEASQELERAQKVVVEDNGLQVLSIVKVSTVTT